MPNFELTISVPENPDKENNWHIRPTTEPKKPFRCEIKGDYTLYYRCVGTFESKEAATTHWAPLIDAFEKEPSHVG
jgi:hypothetical protein